MAVEVRSGGHGFGLYINGTVNHEKSFKKYEGSRKGEGNKITVYDCEDGEERIDAIDLSVALGNRDTPLGTYCLAPKDKAAFVTSRRGRAPAFLRKDVGAKATRRLKALAKTNDWASRCLLWLGT